MLKSAIGPAAASLATIIFLFSWNNFLWPLAVIKSDYMATFPVGLSAFAQPPTNEPQWAMVMGNFHAGNAAGGSAVHLLSTLLHSGIDFVALEGLTAQPHCRFFFDQ